ncbi:MAG: phosphoribosylglycinamide formyltransferase, partial [Thermoleophilaceae bacterium]
MALRIAVLVSGEGTNLQAILDAAHGREEIEVVCVGASGADAGAVGGGEAGGVWERVFSQAEHHEHEGGG